MSRKIVAAFITDTHSDHDNHEHVLSIYSQFLTNLEEIGYQKPFFIHAGDHFKYRSGQRLPSLLGFQDQLNLIHGYGYKMITIDGNHDKSDQDKDDSFLDVYSTHQSLELAKTSSNDQIDKNIVFHFLPFYTEHIYLKKLSDIKVDPSKKNVLITHYGVEGALDNDASEVKGDVKIGKFKKFDLVLSGHYHNYQKIGTNFVYIGSTDARNFGEDSNKGFVILYDDLKMERVKLDFFEFQKVYLESTDLPFIEKKIQEYKNPNKKVRFIFSCSEEEWLKVDKRKIEANGIEVVFENTTIRDFSPKEDLKNVKMTNSDLLKSFVSYSSNVKLEKKLLEKGLKLLKK
jgi:predicted phosphodiesterase